MRLSEERIAYLSRRIAEELLNEEHVDLEVDEDRFSFLIESKFTELLMLEDQIDEEASAWVHTHKPQLEDGTTEFEIELEKTKKTLAEQKATSSTESLRKGDRMRVLVLSPTFPYQSRARRRHRRAGDGAPSRPAP